MLMRAKSVINRFLPGAGGKYRPVQTYWFDDVVNFGDLLTPLLLKMVGLTAIQTPKEKAELLVVGSVLNHLPEEYAGYILGSGLISDIPRQFPYAKILALRGALTRERIGAPAATILGDPGLLADGLLPNRQIKKYVIGVIPHYKDKGNEKFRNLCRKHGAEIKNIDVQKNPLTVIREIDQCNFILSSCLHGIVVVDSLNIPNAWVKLSDRVIGDGFKFRDYSSAFGETLEPVTIMGDESLNDLLKLTHAVYPEINTVKQNLKSAFLELQQAMN